MKANTIFQFLRGAVRSAYGQENFRNKTLLIVGMSNIGQQLLNKLCMDGLNIKFKEDKISNYYRTFAVCRDVDIYQGEKTDIIIDFNQKNIRVKENNFPMDRIGEDPYIQGIHEYYL